MRPPQSPTTAMTGKHTCGHCGKYRSASYHKRHPLANGEWPRPSICTKCAKDKTSGEGSSDSERRYRKKRQRRRRHSLVSMPSRYSLSSWASESDDSDNTRVHTIITSAPTGVISHRNSRRRSSTRGVRVIEYSEGSEESIPWRSRSRSRSLRRYVETVLAIGLFKDGKPTLTAIEEAPHVGTQRLDPMVTVNLFKKPKGRFALMLIFIISKIGGRHSSIAKSDTVLSLVADRLVRTIVAWEAMLVFEFHGDVGGLMDIAIVRIAIIATTHVMVYCLFPVLRRSVKLGQRRVAPAITQTCTHFMAPPSSSPPLRRSRNHSRDRRRQKQ